MATKIPPYSQVFLVSQGYGKPPKVYSEFEIAEKDLLSNLLSSMISKNPGGGYLHTITSVVIDYQWVDEIKYHGIVKTINGNVCIYIKRDLSRFGSEKEFSVNYPFPLGE